MDLVFKFLLPWYRMPRENCSPTSLFTRVLYFICNLSYQLLITNCIYPQILITVFNIALTALKRRLLRHVISPSLSLSLQSRTTLRMITVWIWRHTAAIQRTTGTWDTAEHVACQVMHNNREMYPDDNINTDHGTLHTSYATRRHCWLELTR